MNKVEEELLKVGLKWKASKKNIWENFNESERLNIRYLYKNQSYKLKDMIMVNLFDNKECRIIDLDKFNDYFSTEEKEMNIPKIYESHISLRYLMRRSKMSLELCGTFYDAIDEELKKPKNDFEDFFEEMLSGYALKKIFEFEETKKKIFSHIGADIYKQKVEMDEQEVTFKLFELVYNVLNEESKEKV